MSSPTASLEAQGSVKIRVLIADDHIVVREGLVAILNRQDDLIVVGEATNGREALEQWRKHRPDITPDGSTHARDVGGRGHRRDSCRRRPDLDYHIDHL